MSIDDYRYGDNDPTSNSANGKCPTCTGPSQAPQSKGNPPQDGTDELDTKVKTILLAYGLGTTSEIAESNGIKALVALVTAERHQYAISVLEWLKTHMAGADEFVFEEIYGAIAAEQAMGGEEQ